MRMQSKEKKATPANRDILQQEVYEAMEALGFECLSTKSVMGLSVTVFKIKDESMVEVLPNNTINCYNWCDNEDAPRWIRTFTCDFRRLCIGLQQWILMLHLGRIASIKQVLRLCKEAEILEEAA